MKKMKIVFIMMLSALLVFSSIAVSFAQEGDTQVVPTATSAIAPSESVDPQATASVDPQPTETIDPQATEKALAGLMTEENTIAEPTENGDAVPTEETTPDSIIAENATVEAAATGVPTVTVTINGQSVPSDTQPYARPNDKVELSINVPSDSGAVTYEWSYSSFDKSVVNQFISDQPSITIDPVTVNDYGRYTYKVNGTGRAVSLKPDMQVQLSVNEPEIVAGQPIVISGEASYKKIGSALWDQLEIQLNGSFLEYTILENKEVGGSNSYGMDITDWANNSNGLWSGEKNVLVDNDADYKVAFTVTLKTIPLVLLEEDSAWEGGSVRVHKPEWIYVGNPDYTYYGSEANFTLNLPTTHNIQAAGESASKDNAVKIKGDFPIGAEVALSDVSDTGIVSAMQNALKTGEQFVWLKNISLELAGQHLDFNGELTVSVWMGEAYNGKKLKVLHYKTDGQVEELSGTVTDGYLTFTTSSLSPFGVVANNTASGGSGSTETKKSPKTGDESLPLALLIVMAAGAAGSIAFVLKRQRRHSA